MARKKPSRSQRGALARSSRRKPADVPPAPRVEIAAKERKSGKPAPRVSKHKKRAAWFRSRVTWPMREASRAGRVAERRRASRTLAAGTLVSDWVQAGPSNIGGRATSVIVDPTNADRVWIGAAGGGVWRSTDAGKTWALKWRASGPLEIGSLAIDPTTPTTLYCGTGEANLSLDSYRATASTGRPTAEPRGSRGPSPRRRACRCALERLRSIRSMASTSSSVASASAACRATTTSAASTARRTGERPGSG